MVRAISLACALLLAGCASSTPLVLGGSRTTTIRKENGESQVIVERTPSVLGLIFGEPTPTPGDEAIRESIADRHRSRADVDRSRAELNRGVNTKLQVVKTADELRALAELRSANTPDEGAVSAYGGGRADGYAYGRIDLRKLQKEYRP